MRGSSVHHLAQDVLQIQRLLQRRHAAAGHGDLLLHAVQRKQQRAAGDGLNLLHHRQVHQIAAVHTEESVAIEALLQLGEAHRGEVAVGIGLQVGVVVAGHDEADLVDADEDLLAALFHGDALGLVSLQVQGTCSRTRAMAWAKRSVSTGLTK